MMALGKCGRSWRANASQKVRSLVICHRRSGQRAAWMRSCRWLPSGSREGLRAGMLGRISRRMSIVERLLRSVGVNVTDTGIYTISCRHTGKTEWRQACNTRTTRQRCAVCPCHKTAPEERRGVDCCHSPPPHIHTSPDTDYCHPIPPPPPTHTPNTTSNPTPTHTTRHAHPAPWDTLFLTIAGSI
jgi:hypothetical protein